jgi:WhiB family transcriptional regulator, redox-sensing transcriptional regulator
MTGMTATIPALALRHCETCGHEIPRRSCGQPQYLKRRFCSLRCRRQTGPKRMPKRTPAPPVDISWQPRAACRDQDPELFFSDSHSTPDKARVERARAVCSGCPVAYQCLQYAMATDSYGVWAGTTKDQRDALKRRVTT